MQCVQESVCWAEPGRSWLLRCCCKPASIVQGRDSGIASRIWNWYPSHVAKLMSQALNLQDNPEGSSKDRKPVICRAASHPHLAPYCSHLPVAGCSHIRGANSCGLLCAAHTHLSSQPMGHGWVRRWQKEPSGGRGTNPEAFRYRGEWQRHPVGVVNSVRKSSWDHPASLPRHSRHLLGASSSLVDATTFYTGSIERCEAEICPMDVELFISLVFSISSLGLDRLMTPTDSISVKAPLSTFLTCSQMPCVCFTNLLYCTFRWEGTEKLSARLLLAVRRWLGRSRETIVSTVFLPCPPPYCTRVFWKLLQVPPFG